MTAPELIIDALTYGDITDLRNYGGALIDERAFAKNVKAIERAKGTAGVTRPDPVA